MNLLGVIIVSFVVSFIVNYIVMNLVFDRVCNLILDTNLDLLQKGMDDITKALKENGYIK